MKRILFFSITFLFSCYLYSQKFVSNSKYETEKNITKEEENYELNSSNASFSRVLTGKAVFQPIKLSDSTVLITDAKTLACVKDDGSILWEKKLRNASDAKIYKLCDDFIILISRNNTTLTLYNQSGIQIFQKIFQNKIISSPLEGFDSRFFIATENKIYCFSISGKQKWEIADSFNSRQLYYLNDGSLLCYKNIDSNTSRLKRISPFGEVMEEIDFPKKIQNICQTPNGLLLTFTSELPEFIYFDEKSGKISKKWTLLENSNQESKEILKNIIYEKSNILTFNKNYFIYYFQSDKKIYFNFVDYDKGNLQKFFFIDMEDSFKSYKCSCNSKGIFVLNSSTAAFYDNFGRIAWKKAVSKNEMEKPIFYIFTSDNNLLFFTENWCINYFPVHKTPETKNKNLNNSFNDFSTSAPKASYSHFYQKDFFNENDIFQEKLLPEIFDTVKAQNYGKMEQNYTINLMYYLDKYISEINRENFGVQDTTSEFEKNINLTSKLIILSFNFENTEFTQRAAKILESEKNKTLLLSTLNGINQFSYDPDYKLLNQIELLSKTVSPNDELLISTMLDATCSICSFMGKPAFEKYGNLIIKNFLASRFHEKTRKKAQETYRKISKIFQN